MEKLILLWKRFKNIFISTRVKSRIAKYTASNFEKNARIKVLNYLESNKEFANSNPEVFNFLKSYNIHIFPYDFIFKYNPLNIKVFHEDGLPYVYFDSKKLFFRKGMSNYQVMNAMNNLLIEQDQSSAHCYFNFIPSDSKKNCIVDIGAAEGIFALKLIDQVDECILVETEQSWLTALEHTFRPYADKVTICNKFVSDVNDDHHISMDNLIQDKRVDIVKIDVDGNEYKLFQGFEGELKRKSVGQILLCVYHDVDDYETYTSLLHSYGYNLSKNESKMIFYYGENWRAPYLTYGVVNAKLRT